MTSYAHSTSQIAYFEEVKVGTGNIVVEAVAGAGKTSTLIDGLDFMSGKVFLGAYNSKMAAELKQRVAGRKGVYASTFHSAGFRQLMFSWKAEKLDVTDKKVQRIVDGMKTIRADLEPVAPYIAGIVSMAKQRGIGALIAAGDANDNAVWQAMIDHFDLLENFPEGLRTDQIIPFARAVLKKSNADHSCVDFDDMVYLPLLLKLPMLKHEWVIVDEAQDTNPTRRALAAAMLGRGGRLVAVGDPHQAIFGFTGADNDSLELIAKQFMAKKLYLSVSYRCPKAVVEQAQKFVSHIESADKAPDGFYGEVAYKDLISTVKPGQAILSRYNKFLVKTCFALIREGIPAMIEGRKVGHGILALAQRWPGVKRLTALKDKLEGYRSKEVEKATLAENMVRVDAVHDLVDTMQFIIDHVVKTNADAGMAELQTQVMSMFGDEVSSDDKVTLCSVHRSKGLEWHTVYVLGLNEIMPSPFVTSGWAYEQEVNLQYVAVTRAKNTLINVTGMEMDKRS
jgi:DNA helicase-2/ATP-dependent DNA helicase PcrA